MSIITIFSYFKRPKSVLPLINVLNQIKTGKYRRMITKLREAYSEGPDGDFDGMVRIIPRFSVSGNFKLRNEQMELISYSGNLLLEIPYLNSHDLKTVKMLLAKDRYVMACFENALCNGLVFIVRSNGAVADHKKIFGRAVRYYKKLTGVNRFSYLGKHIDHTCMVSLDEYAYIGLEADSFVEFQPA